MVKVHLSGYQARDEEVVDYHMYQLGDTELWFRGPEHEADALRAGHYFTCIGAAQTFGCFCERPFPAILQDELNRPALNLGYGGAGPAFYLSQPSLLPYINSGRFAIVQVMSGRSESNALFDSGGLEYLTRRRDGKKFSATDAWNSVLECRYAWNKLPVGKQFARRICRQIGTKRAVPLVEETRNKWCDNFVALLNQITVPKILLWISKRSPDYVERYDSLATLFAEFPQLVNREMVETIRPLCDEYVECVTRRGSPQPLVSRHTGQPCSVDLGKDRADFAGVSWTENAYYPSPEMQEDAAEMLLEVTRRHADWC